MSTEFLKKHAETLAAFAAETREHAAKNPEDFWLQMAADNQTQAAGDAMQDLKIAYAEEAGELLDLRFIGPKADGSILLDTFIKIAQPLSRAWKLAAYRLRNGAEPSRIDNDIGDELNLKLAGMAYGSTRILVTGNARPDMTGESLLQATLDQTFRLLTVNNDDFFDAVDAIGGKAAHEVAESMKAIDHAGLAVEFAWQSPKGRLTWDGRPDEVVRDRTLLSTLQEPEHYTEEITGYVAGITDTGRLDIRTPEGKISIRFPLRMTEMVQKLSIAKLATIKVHTARYWDAVGKRDVFKRQMVDLLPLLDK